MHADTIALWALILSVVAIIAHIPLTMFSHHYLPKVENYFASRSKEQLAKRIHKLKTQRSLLSHPLYIENARWRYRENLCFALYLLGGGLYCQAVAIFHVMGILPFTKGNTG